PLFHQRQLPAEGVLPARIAIELTDAALDDTLPPMLAVDRGGVARVRVAGPEPRVVVDLQPGAAGRVFYLTEPYRIVIDVEARAARRARNNAPVIVLDPGHGGHEPGAANDRYDLVEAKLALDIATLTRSRLQSLIPGAHIILTRDGDTSLSLEARCALANSLEADVFVSIHLNAGSGDVTKGGVTTFVLDTTNNRQALRLAARENGTRTSKVTGIQALLAHHHRSGQSAQSRELADMIQRTTLDHGRRTLPSLTDRGVREAMFYVLVGARMPAVLVEASFLTYEPEARALTTPRYRRRLASGIASGIAAFLETR
ncbi:MAG: N-acetylmuramoyl-L-alanine amidase, partial [Polyangiales bacterium]